MDKAETLSPLCLTDDPTKYRVPLSISENGEMTLFVGDAHIRMFTDKTLPDCLKPTLTQIRVIQGDRPFRGDMYSTQLMRGEWMTNKTGIRSLDRIGWRVNKTLYVLIVDIEDFKMLRGENDFDNMTNYKGGNFMLLVDIHVIYDDSNFPRSKVINNVNTRE